jgi:hypothetical protein
MDDLTKRTLLFLFGCMGARITIAWLAKTHEKLLPLIAIFALGVAIGMFRIYLTNSRTTGPEVLGGKIWWNSIRPLHVILWASFAIAVFLGIEGAWKILAADVLLGLAAFLLQRSGLAFA